MLVCRQHRWNEEGLERCCLGWAFFVLYCIHVFVLGLSVNSLVKPWAQIPQLNIPHGAFLLPFAALFPAQLSSCLGLPFSGVTSLVILILEQFTCLLLCSFAASEKRQNGCCICTEIGGMGLCLQTSDGCVCKRSGIGNFLEHNFSCKSQQDSNIQGLD